MHDQELRGQFAQWAKPLREISPPPLVTLRRRARRRVAKVAAATGAAMAVAGLAIGIAMSSAGRAASGPALTGPGTSHWGNAKFPAPPSQPYLVTIAQGGSSARLLNMATGQVVQTFYPLAAGDYFTRVVAAPGDRLFVLAEQSGTGPATFAGFWVSRSGQPTFLVRMLTEVSVSNQIYALALNSAGSRLAVATVPPGGAGPEELTIYAIPSCAVVGSWRADGGQILGLSWAAGGTLTFGWRSDTNGSADNGLRQLDMATGMTQGTVVADSRLLATVSGFDGATISPDGATVIALSLTGRQVWLDELSARSGRLQHSIALGSQAALGSANFCGPLWVGPDGTELLAQCGQTQLAVVSGQATRTRLAFSPKASVVGWANTFAW